MLLKFFYFDRSTLKKCGEDITMTYNMVVGILSHIPLGLVVAEDMIITVAKGLTSAEELYVYVTNDVLVTVS